VERLSSHFRVVVVEMPGSGRGQHVPHPWSFAAYADWLAEFLRVYGLRRVVVIGHSDSGAVALRLAAHNPEHIDRLVVVDTVGVRRQPLLNVLGGRAWDGAIEWKLTLWGFHHPLLNILRHGRNFWSLVKDSASQQPLPGAQDLSVRTVVAWGARDHTMPFSHCGILARQLGSAQVLVSRGGSHDWLITHADEFVERLLRVYSDQAPGAALSMAAD
jgi:pimeloyl-ACP methyl ester carboxylesterase